MYRFDHDGDVVRVDQGMDAVPQIEHMTAARAEIRQQGRHFLANPGGRRIQHTGVEIALQRNLPADPPTGINQIDRPIES